MIFVRRCAVNKRSDVLLLKESRNIRKWSCLWNSDNIFIQIISFCYQMEILGNSYCHDMVMQLCLSIQIAADLI